jgi:membrane protein involved in colicin uptake
MSRNEKLAAALLVISCVLYAGLFAVPFLGASTSTKAGIGGGLVLAGEGAFWLGAVIAGREVMVRYRRKLSPRSWFRRSEDPTPSNRDD